ncbi:MAG: energy transducer TonB [Algoriphagus aquaeductus]|uniref:TonB family protein n=2 Tax=Algoriphagus TaxID=246875 RepID=A0A326RUR7_9BACT|nr:energy transducer TonB [Algoriphagus aquaeductus]PZV83961.1 TonB family protein [Algoriphagus aquaeductus]
MKNNLMKIKHMALISVLGLGVTFSSCQIDQAEEIEGPTQVAAKPSMAPTNIAARITDVGKDGKEIFDVTEVQPVPPGGLEGWNSYLLANLKYPSEAKKLGIEGTVIVDFVINSDGSISNPTILRGIGGGCDEEAIRVVQNSANWEPAQQKDRKVNSRMKLPVRFKLS